MLCYAATCYDTLDQTRLDCAIQYYTELYYSMLWTTGSNVMSCTVLCYTITYCTMLYDILPVQLNMCICVYIYIYIYIYIGFLDTFPAMSLLTGYGILYGHARTWDVRVLENPAPVSNKQLIQSYLKPLGTTYQFKIRPDSRLTFPESQVGKRSYRLPRGSQRSISSPPSRPSRLVVSHPRWLSWALSILDASEISWVGRDNYLDEVCHSFHRPGKREPQMWIQPWNHLKVTFRLSLCPLLRRGL